MSRRAWSSHPRNGFGTKNRHHGHLRGRSRLTVSSKMAFQRWTTIEDSYCAFIKRSAKSFSLQDSLSDLRVEGHPKQLIIHSYYGLPVLGTHGELLGTVCHFDCDTRPLMAETVDLLDAVAPPPRSSSQTGLEVEL